MPSVESNTPTANRKPNAPVTGGTAQPKRPSTRAAGTQGTKAASRTSSGKSLGEDVTASARSAKASTKSGARSAAATAKSATRSAKAAASKAGQRTAAMAEHAAEDVKESASRAATIAKRKAASAADALVGQAESVADDAISRTRQQALQFAETGKQTTNQYVSTFSRAISAAATSLHEDGMERTSAYVRAAADGLERASDEIDGFDTQGVAGRVENFVRSQPLLTVGALALVGFALAGTVKPRNRA